MKSKDSLVGFCSLILLYSVVLIDLYGVPFSRAIELDDVRTELYSAFEQVVEAEEKGGDVGPLVDELNRIVQMLDLASEDDLPGLLNRVHTVSQNAALVGSVGESAGNYQLYLSISILLFTGLIILFVWALLPGVFWRFWLRSKRGWLVSS